MIISHKHRFIFVHIPRTAGQSIGKALSQSVKEIEYIHGAHSSISALNGCHDYQAFTFVRNPWDRALSLYAFYVRRKQQPTKQGFVAFIANPPEDGKWLVRQQVDYICGQRHVAIGKFEQLAEDFKAMCGQFAFGDISLPHINVSTKLPAEEFYDEHSLALVDQVFPEDIASLGYAMLRPASR